MWLACMCVEMFLLFSSLIIFVFGLGPDVPQTPDYSEVEMRNYFEELFPDFSDEETEVTGYVDLDDKIHPSQFAMEVRELLDDTERVGPDLSREASMIELLPSGQVLWLDHCIITTGSSSLWAVHGNSDLLVKYQIYMLTDRDMEYFHPLSREYYMMSRIQHMGFTPKVHYLSGPSLLLPRFVSSEKVSHVNMADQNWQSYAVGRDVRFMVMERIHGAPLCQMQTFSFTENQVALIGFKMLKILQQLHDHAGIVHGDIHAGNLIYESARNGLKLIDFGLANFIMPANVQGPPRAQHYLYAPWEQEGFRPERRDDVYRAVIILVEFFVGYNFLEQWFNQQSFEESLRAKKFANLFAPRVKTNSNNPHVTHLTNLHLAHLDKWSNILKLAQSVNLNERPPYEAILAQLLTICRS